MPSAPTPPAFASTQQYASCLTDVGFWWPYLAGILERHDLADAAREPVAGFNATYPTFVCGDLVVKLFGHFRAWRESHAAERAAQALIATDPGIAAPRVLAEGRLVDDGEAPWPYLILTRVPGVASWRAALSREERSALAAELGRQVRRVHALPARDLAADTDWPALQVGAAAQRSSLPPRLIAQIPGYLARLGPFDRVFVHGDLVANHVFVESGRFAGIIDWGDAVVTDRHYELAKLYFDAFRCDKALLRTFLDASDWPVAGDFPRKALGLALYRQATGRAQHLSFDVFHTLPTRLPLEDVGTLDELATELFAL